ANVVGERGDEAREIRLQRTETGGPRERNLVHVEPPVDLDLKAVPALRRAPVLAHQLDTLVRVVDRDLVAHRRERRGDKRGEFRFAGGAVAIAQDELGSFPARIDRHDCYGRWLR